MFGLFFLALSFSVAAYLSVKAYKQTAPNKSEFFPLNLPVGQQHSSFQCSILLGPVGGCFTQRLPGVIAIKTPPQPQKMPLRVMYQEYNNTIIKQYFWLFLAVEMIQLSNLGLRGGFFNHVSVLVGVYCFLISAILENIKPSYLPSVVVIMPAGALPLQQIFVQSCVHA